MSQVPAGAVPPPHDPYAPLRLPGFRWFVTSILAMALGAQIQGIVVAWQMYALTHDPLALGMVGLAEALPFIGLALPAGHVADVRDRRRIALFALVVLCGAARSVLLPSRNALAAEVVPRPLFASSVAWRTGIWQVAAVTGPAVGGILYESV